MKLVYPVIFTEDPAGGYMAYVPDLEINPKAKIWRSHCHGP